MEKINMTTAIKRYNNIMNDLCYEYHTIGDVHSEEHTANWNLRDMVAEIDYIRSTYHEIGHNNHDELKAENPKQWRSEEGKLSRFISHYEKYIGDLVCVEGHCSKYDN